MKLSPSSQRVIIISAITGTLLVLGSLAGLRFESTVRAEGYVVPEQQARLYAPEQAIVREVFRHTGEPIQAGDLILVLESVELTQRHLEVQRAKLDIQTALNEVDLALRKHTVRPLDLEMATAAARAEREARIHALQNELAGMYDEIREQYVVSQLDVNLREIERLRSEIDLERSQMLAAWLEAGWADLERESLEMHRHALEQQQALTEREEAALIARLDRLEVKAPFDGHITALPTRYVGERVEPGQLIAKVANRDAGYLVRAHAPPRNIDLVRIGAPVIMESLVFDSVLEGRVYGEVIRITPDILRDPTLSGQDGYEVDIAITDTPHDLMFGSPVRAKISIGRRTILDIFFRSAGTGRRDASGAAP